MKEYGKKLLAGLFGVVCARFSWLGLYPMIPAYFTAVEVEGSMSNFGLLCVMFGMIAYMPTWDCIKYGTILLCIRIVLAISGKLRAKRTHMISFVLAAGITFCISYFGGMLSYGQKGQLLAFGFEACLMFGASYLMFEVLQAFLALEQPTRKKFLNDEIRSRQMNTYADSFMELSKAFHKRQEYEPKEDMVWQVTGRVCADCDVCYVCWQQKKKTIYELLKDLLGSTQRQEEWNEEHRLLLQENCKQFDRMIAEMEVVWENAKVNKAWYNRLVENQEVIAGQLDIMASVLRKCAVEDVRLEQKMGRELTAIRTQAKREGFLVEEVSVWEDSEERLHVRGMVCSPNGNCLYAKNFQKILEKNLKKSLALHKDCRSVVGKDIVELCYNEKTKYHLEHSIKRLSKNKEEVCGDSFSVIDTNDLEKRCFCLSDGMGTGIAANEESEFVVEMLEKFLNAGFSVEQSFSMMNAAMVIRDNGENFSTFDVAEVDLYTGECQCYKAGGTTSYIRHADGKVSILSSNTLPAGILINSEITKQSYLLQDGDFLVMLTDGMLEYIQTEEMDAEERMCQILSGIKTNHPGVFGQRLLEEVLPESVSERRDDVTVLVVAVWEN